MMRGARHLTARSTMHNYVGNRVVEDERGNGHVIKNEKMLDRSGEMREGMRGMLQTHKHKQ